MHVKDHSYVYAQFTHELSSGFKFAQLEISESRVLALQRKTNLNRLYHAEVVLTLLIGSFKFTLSDKRIIWKMRGLTSPAVEGDSDPLRIQLPLVVQLAD